MSSRSPSELHALVIEQEFGQQTNDIRSGTEMPGPGACRAESPPAGRLIFCAPESARESGQSGASLTAALGLSLTPYLTKKKKSFTYAPKPTTVYNSLLTKTAILHRQAQFSPEEVAIKYPLAPLWNGSSAPFFVTHPRIGIDSVNADGSPSEVVPALHRHKLLRLQRYSPSKAYSRR